MAWEYFIVLIVGVCTVVLVVVITIIVCWLLVFRRHSKIQETRAKRLMTGSTVGSDVSYPTMSKTALPEGELSQARTFNKNAFNTLTMSERFDYMFRSDGTPSSSLKSDKSRTVSSIASLA